MAHRSTKAVEEEDTCIIDAPFGPPYRKTLKKKIAYPPPFWGIEDSHGADVGTHSSRNADLVMTATAVVSIEINDT